MPKIKLNKFKSGLVILSGANNIVFNHKEFFFVTIHFSYDKRQVLQALRYHFLARSEIRIMIILVNVFALSSAVLYYSHKITPMAFLVGSFLWFVLMITFWFLLPGMVYRRAATFKDHFTMSFDSNSFSVGNERGSRSWAWTALARYIESPHFFHLYFDTNSFFLVPKNGFSTSDDVYQIRQLLKEKVGK